MKNHAATWGFLAVGIMSMAAALIPLFKGGSMNLTFLGAAVVFFAVAAAAARKARHRNTGP